MGRRTRLAAAGLAIGLIATACGDDLEDGQGSASDGDEVTIDRNEISLTSGLATFDDCNALLTHLQTEGAERVGAYGFDGSGGWFGPVFGIEEDDAMEEEAVDTASADADFAVADSADAGGEAARAQGALVEGEDFSGTNNQEQGVDEPDIVKTDGERIITISNGQLTTIDVTSGQPVVRGSLTVGYEVGSLLIVGDRAYAFGTTWGGEAFPIDIAVEDGVVDDVEASFAREDVVPGPDGWFGPQVLVTEIDLSDLDEPSTSGTLTAEGSFLNARKIGNSISIAIQSDPVDLGFVYPQSQSGEDRAAEFNKDIVGDTSLDDWLPSFRLDANGSTSQGLLTDCADVHAPNEFAGFGSLSVMTFDGTDGLGAPNAASVLASGQNVYASPSTMWISTNSWIDWGILEDDAARDQAAQEYTSQLHGFRIDGSSPGYLASGEVRGHLLNQFAMSEHEGVLRVATTDGVAWWADESSESFVTTFSIDAEEKALRQLGQVGDMGKGEQIFSVRFVGDLAYVVTFRQTDPFYTVDLADPSAPKVLGELKITGYSGQLHPLSSTMVLGIGQEATEDGRTTGAKMSLFDVSDLANPVDVDTWTVPNAWTDAEWDHKSFLWWPAEDLAVIPVSNWSEQFWGAIAFRIDLDEGTITEAGRLSHEPDDTQKIGTTDCRVVEASELEQFRDTESVLAELSWEAEWITQDGGQIQICQDGQSGASGLYCDRWWGDELDLGDLGDGELEMCWPEGPGGDPIVRTLVIGDNLYTMSWSELQQNDLATFAPGERVSIS